MIQRYHLSHFHVQMARELGLNPKKLGSIANHDQEHVIRLMAAPTEEASVTKVPVETTILTDSQVRTLTKHLRDMLKQSFPVIDMSQHDPETSIRMMALSAKCKEAREKRALSIKDVAVQVDVPQYRITAIESSSMGELKPEYLQSYVEFLDLKRWVRRWVAANAELAKRLGIHDI